MELLNKQQVIEIMYRPCPITETMLSTITKQAMKLDNFELAEAFTKSTKLNLTPFAHNLFKIEY